MPPSLITHQSSLIAALAFCLFTLPFLACEVDERRQLPPEAQEAIDRVTEDVAAGRDEKVYQEAADEWRASVTPAESQKTLARVRTQLGRVQSRAMHTGKEKTEGGRHTLSVTYQTTFERGTGMETFKLLERDGRWLLAGYSVTSDALKQ